MSLEQLTDTALEPLTLAEAKTWLREDPSASPNDTDIQDLVTAARRHAENYLGRCIKAQAFRLTLDHWPNCNFIQLPRHKPVSVTVTYRDSAEAPQTLSASEYLLDAAAARVALRYGRTWPSAILSPSGAILVEFSAGNNENAYPAGIKLFVKQAIAHFYRNREAVTLGNSAVDSKLLEMGAYKLLDNDPGTFKKYS
jgi:uncharacterized phiE125 gp8 family phage protein